MISLVIMSDLHVEKGPYAPPPIAADLVVLAGDIGWGLEGVRWAAEHLGGRPAVYVAGNREYWQHPEGTAPLAALRAAAAEVPGLRFLQDDEAVFELPGGRLRVLGATLWTDYTLEGDQDGTMRLAQERMPDYRNGRGPDGDLLTAEAVLASNRASVAFLACRLAESFDGPTIVVSHHVPSARSLKARRPEHVPTVASVTQLDALIEDTGPALWIHGHTHWNCDYRIGRTRILTNQRGGPENEEYAPLTVAL
ncbi:MAG: metallophosphoesterase [Solirubrobacterales bacterium]